MIWTALDSAEQSQQAKNNPPGGVTRVSTKQWIMEAQSDVSDGDVGNLVGSDYNSDGAITNDWTAYYHEPFRITLNVK